MVCNGANPDRSAGSDRRAFLKLGLGSALAAAGVAGVGCSKWRRRALPNVLLITLDTTRIDHLSCYGATLVRTPNLDQLASESVLYTQAIADSSWTLPAHASLFTGKAVTCHGSRFDPDGDLALADVIAGPDGWDQYRARGLSKDEATLAQILKEAGYICGAVVGGPWLKRIFGLHKGFDHYDDDDIGEIQGRPAPRITERALKWVAKVRDKPFFLFLNYFDPHNPYILPDDFVKKFLAGHKDTSDFVTEWQTDAIADDNALYAAEVRYMDQYIGVLVRNLKTLGLYDNTLIVVTADHGELLGEHNLHGHGVFLFQEEIHIPFFVKYPRREIAPSRTGTRIQLTDVLPLILDRVGVSPPSDVQGSFPKDPGAPIVSEIYPLPLFCEHGVSQSIYDGPYKYVWNSKEHTMLFDLRKHPHESRNLLSVHAERATAMEDRLKTYLAGLPKPGAPAAPKAIDEETREALKGLGYM